MTRISFIIQSHHRVMDACANDSEGTMGEQEKDKETGAATLYNYKGKRNEERKGIQQQLNDQDQHNSERSFSSFPSHSFRDPGFLLLALESPSRSPLKKNVKLFNGALGISPLGGYNAERSSGKYHRDNLQSSSGALGQKLPSPFFTNRQESSILTERRSPVATAASNQSFLFSDFDGENFSDDEECPAVPFRDMVTRTSASSAVCVGLTKFDEQDRNKTKQIGTSSTVATVAKTKKLEIGQRFRYPLAPPDISTQATGRNGRKTSSKRKTLKKLHRRNSRSKERIQLYLSRAEHRRINLDNRDSEHLVRSEDSNDGLLSDHSSSSSHHSPSSSKSARSKNSNDGLLSYSSSDRSRKRPRRQRHQRHTYSGDSSDGDFANEYRIREARRSRRSRKDDSLVQVTVCDNNTDSPKMMHSLGLEMDPIDLADPTNINSVKDDIWFHDDQDTPGVFNGWFDRDTAAITNKPTTSFRKSFYKNRRNAMWMVAVGVVMMFLVITISLATSKKPGTALSPDEAIAKPSAIGPVFPIPELSKKEVVDNEGEFGEQLTQRYMHLGFMDQHNELYSSLLHGATPAGMALTWVAGSKAYATYTQQDRFQRFALATFYYATYQQEHSFLENSSLIAPADFEEGDEPKLVAPGWSSANKWMSKENVCIWEGVSCTENGQVTGILLPNHYLTGKLPTELVLLKDHLETLDLSGNLIHMNADEGDFDVFSHLTELHTLLMNDNYILSTSGLPAAMGKMRSLRRVNLSYNLLQGQIDGSIFGLTQLQQLSHLEVESNYLSGELPSELGRLPSLIYLYIRRNLLDMRLSDLLVPGAYRNIFAMWLDNNKFSGTIPSEVGALSGLASFSISNSTLTGKIPTELGKLTDLRRLWLYGNQLTGRIPSQLGNLDKLEVLEIFDTKLMGYMPRTVCKAVESSSYQYATLSADCSLIKCDGCCTRCY